ncbi:hypothetical protein [Candidatus Pantoea persica]|uniref:hypothetical protein n=1 Tax=Candidatus Pantoea persica TaxID=2518128 RepID=UPI00215D8D13|nr:hypothetical protein [Candidatus Pantoea persica]
MLAQGAQRYAFQRHLHQGVIAGDSNDLLPIAFLQVPQLPAAQQARLMQALTAYSAAATTAVASAAAPDTNYGNRDGFRPDFLDGAPIDLAAIIAPRAAEVAPLRDGRQGAEARLDYQHFSLLMSAERRLAFFTATNIEGARYLSIDHGSGQPSLLEEGDR